MSKSYRQGQILKLVRSKRILTQDELAQELKSRTYQAMPVRRVYISKPDGKQRPLGVPAIRDRTAEMAAVLVLEPIFEADCSRNSTPIGETAARWTPLNVSTS